MKLGCFPYLLHSFPQGSSMQQGMLLCHSWGEEEEEEEA
jgi:hypothetical protein